MQHLNYCRQIRAQALSSSRIEFEKAAEIYTRMLHSWPLAVYYAIQPQELDLFLRDIDESIKFSMPRGGRLIDDGMQYKGIQGLEPFRLPFEKIAIEFVAGSGGKIVVLLANTNQGDVHCRLLRSDDSGIWRICSSSWIKTDSPLVYVDGAYTLPVQRSQALIDAEEKSGESLSMFYSGPISTMLDFLNALACKNVHIEKSPAKSTKQGKKVKAALPFDDYHFLTVDVPGKSGSRGEGLGGSHRSPREHLRRGHIRRLDSGPIWVNACVVNAGIGSKVGKSYLVRKSA